MTDASMHHAPSVSIVDIIVESCALSRDRCLPARTVSNSFELTFSHTPSHPDQVRISLKATTSAVSTTDGTPGPSPATEATVACLLVASEPMQNVPDALRNQLLRLAWPYLRSTLDTLTGLSRTPPFPLPIAAPLLEVAAPVQPTVP